MNIDEFEAAALKLEPTVRARLATERDLRIVSIRRFTQRHS
jgi:hypothetical protein